MSTRPLPPSLCYPGVIYGGKNISVRMAQIVGQERKKKSQKPVRQYKSCTVHMEATTPLRCTLLETIINFRCQGLRGHGKIFLAGIPDLEI